MKALGTKDVMKEYISEIKSRVNLVELKKIKYFSDTGTELSEEVKQLPNDKGLVLVYNHRHKKLNSL